jgi:A/G-specific adenine glycosylase
VRPGRPAGARTPAQPRGGSGDGHGNDPHDLRGDKPRGKPRGKQRAAPDPELNATPDTHPRAELIADFAPRVVAWQRHAGRHALPWQQTRDPYRVWLSEIMLQQTQVTTVLAYYERFLQRFPTVRALSEAPLDEVLAAWSGLGYYSRARHLHRCAAEVVQRFGGEFPRSAQLLQTLPGIGRSTAAAIAAFCFQERAAILDGNVKRVLARVLAFEGDLAQAAQERLLWQHATALLPEGPEDMPAYTQGLMDLGASLCAVRNPGCGDCPVRELCGARARGIQRELPVKTRKLRRTVRQSWWLWLQSPQGLWLVQRPPQGVWAGLWTLPLFDAQAPAVAWAQGVDAAWHALPPIEHALTHFDWVLHTAAARVERALSEAEAARLGAGRWVALQALEDVALPAPLRRLAERLKAR